MSDLSEQQAIPIVMRATLEPYTSVEFDGGMIRYSPVNEFYMIYGEKNVTPHAVRRTFDAAVHSVASGIRAFKHAQAKVRYAEHLTSIRKGTKR